MSVFREMVVEYKGETYALVPSNKLLRRIEREVSLAEIFAQLSQGKPRISDCAFLICELLNEAGADTDEDDVLSDLMQDFAQNDGKGFAAIMGQFVEAMQGPVGDEPAKKKPTKSKRRKG